MNERERERERERESTFPESTHSFAQLETFVRREADIPTSRGSAALSIIITSSLRKTKRQSGSRRAREIDRDTDSDSDR